MKKNIKTKDILAIVLRIDLFLIILLVTLFIYQLLPQKAISETTALPKIDTQTINTLTDLPLREFQNKTSPFN